MIQDHSEHGASKEPRNTLYTLGKDSSVPLMRHDLSDLRITDPDLDRPKGTHPYSQPAYEPKNKIKDSTSIATVLFLLLKFPGFHNQSLD